MRFRYPAYSYVLFALFLLGNIAEASIAMQVTHKVRIYWSFTDAIEIELYGEQSPRHVANFLRYVNEGVYDDSFSHRSDAYGPKFLQGGSFSVPDPFDINALGSNPIVPTYGPIQNEYDPSNGLFNSPGTLAAARTAHPDSATTGWFINVTNNANAFPNYTVFGKVTKGFNILSAIPYQIQLWQINQLYAARDPDDDYLLHPLATTPIVNTGTNQMPQLLLPVFQKFVEIPVVPGDINMDGIVSQADLDAWAAAQAPLGSVTNFAADLNGDRRVDDYDRQIVLHHLGNGQLNNLVGDFNGNGVVNQADYLWWKTLYGSTEHLYADANGDGIVDAADYTLWRNNLGATLPGALQIAGAANVPEPSTAIAAVILGLSGGAIWRRKRRRDAVA